MDRDSNIYTFLFSAIMVLVVAATLAATATSLQDIQAENVRKEKMQNILATIGIVVEREKAPEIYTKYIIEELALVSDGSIDEKIDAFKLKLNLEIKKPIQQQRFPLYLAKVDSLQYYIVPLRGSGLWDAIWGYVALEGDKNTIKGAVFDHKGETAGLGAEITQKWFQDRFTGEKIFNNNGKLVGVNVSKTNNDPSGNDKDDNEVDAISGATITGDGVTDMIIERLQNYLSYFNMENTKMASLN
jgi:Na+-transporting NADH:ubiquinone oxidoreductase subunit C